MKLEKKQCQLRRAIKIRSSPAHSRRHSHCYFYPTLLPLRGGLYLAAAGREGRIQGDLEHQFIAQVFVF